MHIPRHFLNLWGTSMEIERSSRSLVARIRQRMFRRSASFPRKWNKNEDEMLSSEQVIPRYFTLLPSLSAASYTSRVVGPIASSHCSHRRQQTTMPPPPPLPASSLSLSLPHRPTNATPSMLFALARPSLPPDCFLFRALCLVLCFRESPRGNDKQMSAALSITSTLSSPWRWRSGRSAFLTRRHGVGERHHHRSKDSNISSLLRREVFSVCKETW